MEHSCGKRSKKGYPQGPKRLALLPEGEASSPFEGLQRELCTAGLVTQAT
jgi:hypothetical protein